VQAEEPGSPGGPEVLGLQRGDDALAQGLLGRRGQRPSIGRFHSARLSAAVAYFLRGVITGSRERATRPERHLDAPRWVQTVRRECLDHFLVFGADHLRHLVTTFTDSYNRRRPHQSRDNRPLTGEPTQSALVPVGAVTCEERLGGLLKRYVRTA
jgi:hypothetical protein